MQGNTRLKAEKIILQSIIVLACMVPLYGGLMGVLRGDQFLGVVGVDLDNHFRYLSGLLIGIGFAFLSTIPHIELNSQRFSLLTFIVVAGGLGRLVGFYLKGLPSSSMGLALGMEMIVTPLLCVWLHSFARRVSLGRA
ncbi:MAG: DUF4345 domain-containing protein [Tatlockia sp.]|nr:DUF4345 domain-containing protein [Tatlockia sp.]